MNDLEKSTYAEPDFGLANDIISETEKTNKDNKKVDNKPRILDDDEIASLGECF